MVINKIVGMVMFILGGFLVFSMYYTEEYDIFFLDLFLGPTLIYLSLKMLNYF